MFSRQYVTYNAVDIDYFTHTWAGTPYNKILRKEWPDDLIDITETTAGTSSPIRFIYPLKQTAVFIDGLASARVTFYNNDAGTGYDLDSYTVKLIKINSSGVPTDLGTHTETPASAVTIAAETYQSFICELEITKQELQVNEKLALEIALTGDTTYVYFAHGYDSTNSLVDTWIKVPYAGGGA